jgi:hypothetical protein
MAGLPAASQLYRHHTACGNLAPPSGHGVVENVRISSTTGAVTAPLGSCEPLMAHMHEALPLVVGAVGMNSVGCDHA